MNKIFAVVVLIMLVSVSEVFAQEGFPPNPCESIPVLGEVDLQNVDIYWFPHPEGFSNTFTGTVKVATYQPEISDQENWVWVLIADETTCSGVWVAAEDINSVSDIEIEDINPCDSIPALSGELELDHTELYWFPEDWGTTSVYATGMAQMLEDQALEDYVGIVWACKVYWVVQ